MSNKRFIAMITIVTLTIATILMVRYAFNEDKPDKILVDGESKHNGTEVNGEDDKHVDLFNQDIDEDEESTGVVEEAQYVPQLKRLIHGKWVLYKTGIRYPNRFIEIEDDFYTENLGSSVLQGNTPDLTEKTPNEVSGKYQLEVDEEDSWKGVLKLKDNLMVKFRYMEDERYEPLIEILPNVLLIRENWERDYRNNPNYTYPNIKE